MLSRAVLDGVVSGEVDLAFRRWTRRAHAPGGSQRTSVGVIAFDEVSVVALDDITADDARRAGTDLDRLRRWLGSKEGEVFRITLRYAGPDQRVSLRAQDRLDPEELTSVVARLAEMDRRSKHGPWTRQHLELIDARPGELAEEIAASIGRTKLPFKADVRRLKELGLTESLRVGYRLSPRGVTVLAQVRDAGLLGDDGRSPPD